MLKFTYTCDDHEDCTTSFCKQNRSNEDRYTMAKIGPIDYYAVFDGHGAGNEEKIPLSDKHVVLWMKQNLHYEIASAIENVDIDNEREVIRAIKELFPQLDGYLFDEGGIGGCAASILLVFASYVLQVNLGDSRSILFDATGNILSETIDHDPRKEEKRIKKVGGYVSRNRVNGVLAMSRAFGDYDLKYVDGEYDPFGPVSSDPFFKVTSRRKGETIGFLICSDGVLDAFNSDSAAAVEKLMRSNLNASCLYATTRNKLDDTTAIAGLI